MKNDRHRATDVTADELEPVRKMCRTGLLACRDSLERLSYKDFRIGSWTMFYTMVDEDTMVWEDHVLGTQWTVHRRR